MTRARLRSPRAWVTPLGVIGALIAGAWVILAAAAPFIVPFDPLAQVLPRLQAPGQEAGSAPTSWGVTCSRVCSLGPA